MSYSCKIILDSISETGKRITTFEITFPRIVLAEFNTHRMFSRNSASSRAIPFKKQIERIKNATFIPEQFPENCVGMQPQQYINNNRKPETFSFLKEKWLEARDNAIHIAEIMGLTLNIHKQIVNRLLEPFQWYTVIVTATEFDNFFKLRTNPNAQYEIKRIADLMYELYHSKLDYEYHKYIDHHNLCLDCDKPESWHYETQKLKVGEWHCPLVSIEDTTPIQKYIVENVIPYPLDIEYFQVFNEIIKKISVARCARVSYLTHDGKRDIKKDLELFERLRTSGHFSPFEHIATPSFAYENKFYAENNTEANEHGWQLTDDSKFLNMRNGNFIGWRQMRQDLPNENCTNFHKE